MNRIDQYLRSLGLVFALFVAYSATFAQTPIAYWMFEDTLGTDSIGSRDFTGNLPYPSSGGLVGNYQAMDRFHQADVPQSQWQNPAFGPLPSDKELSVEFLMRTQEPFDYGRPFLWQGSPQSDIRFAWILTDQEIRVQMEFTSGNSISESFLLNGIGRKDPNYYTDGNWHHIVVTYTAANGRLKVFVDGLCPPGFTYVHGPTAGLDMPQNFILGMSPNSAVFDWHGDLDEIALYNEALSPPFVYQHYLEVQDSQHYSFSQTLTGADVPPIPPVEESQFNPYDFAPGYPNVDSSSLALLRDYPGARFRPSNQLPFLYPWTVDLGKVAGTSNSSGAVQYADAALMQRELIDHYNYMLFLGGSTKLRNGLSFTNPSLETTHYVNLANSVEYDSIPRFIITHWFRAGHYGYRPPGSGPHVLNTNLPNPALYVGNRWSPEAPIDSFQIDGLSIQNVLRNLFLALNHEELIVMGENGEVLSMATATACQQDTFVSNAYASSGYSTWEEYRGWRSAVLRKGYSDVFTEYVRDTVLGGGPYPLFSWYGISGDYSLSRNLNYVDARQINMSGAAGRLDGKRRSTPYYYPQRPGRWRHGIGSIVGMNRFAMGREVEIAAGDSLMNPFVSPGFTDGGDYNIRDEQMIRPGQYLGLLKHLSMLGADTYTNFMYYGGTSGQFHKGNWRVWKTVIPAYAQGITSRVDSFLYQGQVREATDPGRIFPVRNGVGRSHLSFLGNSLNHHITARSLGADRFVFVGSTAKTDPTVSNGLYKDITTIDFFGVPMTFEVRLQGSTYYFDNSDPLNPIFYQLDKWHEWKDPTWWCRDFLFDAEVADQIPSGVRIQTEVPSGNPPMDFTGFTSYVVFDSIVSSPPQLSWSFKAKTFDQDTLHMWILARVDSGSTSSATGWMDGQTGQNFGTISSTSWQWYGLAIPEVQLLDTADHVFHLEPTNHHLQIDRILLKREAGNPVGASLNALFAADTVCAGTEASIINQSAASTSCVDFEWDFGDGTRSFESSDTVFHLFQNPGTYYITLTLTEQCSDSQSVYTDSIVVLAPEVFAGEDQLICPDSIVQLQGSAPVLHFWDVDPALDSIYSLSPTISSNTSNWYYLNAFDAVSGCSGRDSVEVTVVLPALQLPSEYHICLGDSVRLEADGAFVFSWQDTSGTTTLSDTSVAEPWASPLVTTEYTVYAQDACECGWDTASVVVHVYGPNDSAMAWASLDTICDRDTVQLHAWGMSSYRWNYPTWVTDRNIANPFAWPDHNGPNNPSLDYRTRTFQVSGYSCAIQSNVTLNVPIRVGRAVLLDLPDTLFSGICDSVLLEPDTAFGISHLWTPVTGLGSLNSLPCSARVSAPTLYTLSATTNITGCPDVDQVLVIPGGAIPDSVFHCAQDSVTLEAFGGTSVQWTPVQFFSNPNLRRPKISLPASGYVFLSVLDTIGGCSYSDSIWVEVSDPVSISNSRPVEICEGDTIMLTAQGANQYRWIPQAAISDTTAANPLVFPVANSLYSVFGHDSSGCISMDTVSVVVTPYPIATIVTPDTTICEGDSLQLQSTGGGIYSWSPPGSVSDASISNPVTIPSGNIELELTVSTGPGCQAKDTINIAVSSPIASIQTPDTTICLGDSLYLNGTGGGSYSWLPSGSLSNPSVFNPLAFPSISTQYFLSVIDSFGCGAQDSILVEVASPNVNILTGDTNICLGNSVPISASGSGLATWNPVSGLNPTTGYSVTAEPVTSTLFFLTSTDSLGCTSEDSIFIGVQQNPGNIIQTPDTSYCEGVGTIHLQSLPGTSHLWSPGTSLSNSFIPDPFAAPDSSETYTLAWTDSLGCSFEDSVFIEVFPRPLLLYLPVTQPCMGEEVLIETVGGSTFFWQPGGSTNSYFLDSIFQQTTVSVLIGDTNGCFFQDSVMVTPDTNCCVVATADTIVDSTHISTIQSLVNSSSSSNPITVQVRDVLIIDQSGPFEYINFAMDPDARIVIHDQVYTTFNYCHFYSSCGVAMWDGIYFQSSNSGITLVAGTLSDAENGIVGDQGQPIVSNKMVFDRNHIAVQLGPHYGSYPFTMQKTIIECSDTSLMLAPHALERGAYGVKADSVDELQVGISALFQENTFDNLEVGVYSYETSLTLKNNVFQNFDYPAVYSPTNPRGVAVLSEAQSGYTPLPAYHNLVVGGPNIQDQNHFTDCRTGVWARHNLNVTVENNVFDSIVVAGVLIADCKNRTIDVKENKMTEVRLGVVSNLNMNASMRIQKNNITYHGPEEGTGILVDDFMFGSKNQYALCEVIDNDVQALGTGIRVNGIAGAYVENNLVTMDATTDTSQWFIGVHVSGGKGEMVRGNEVYHATGIPDSLTSGIWMENTNEAAVACNVVDGFGRLIVLEGQQANSDLWRNDMSNAVDGLVLWNASLIAEIGGYKRPQDNRWVGGITGGATNCLSTDGSDINLWYDPSGGTSLVPSPNDSGAIPPTFIVGFSINDLQTSGVSNSCSGSLPPPSNKVEKQIAEGSYPISGDSAKTQSLNNQYLFPKLEEDAQLLASDPVFQDAYDSLRYTNIETLYEAEGYLKNNQLASALLDYQALTPSVSVEACLKHPCTIYLEKVAAGQDSLSANDLSVLEMIAAYCPDEEGYGVYQARSILRYFNPLRRWENDCVGSAMKKNPIPGGGETEVISDFEKIKMFPNPTTSQIFFENLPEGGGIIEVRNLLGQVVFDLDYQETESSCQGKVENLSNGSYLVVITSNGGIVFKEKLIIQR